MTGFSNALLVINRRSGSHSEGVERDLLDGFAAAGIASSQVLDCSEATLDLRDYVTAEGFDLVAVHGGDGTMNSIVGQLRGWDGSILPLPGGTSNLLCKRWWSECDSAAIMAKLASGALVPRMPECIEGRDWIALAEVLAGPGARWAEVREDMRDGDILAAAAESIDAIDNSRNGPLVRITEPELGRASGYAGILLSLTEAGMQVRAYRIEGLDEFVRQGAAIIGRNFRDGPHDDLGTAREVLFQSTRDDGIELMIDGERFEGQPEERFSLAPLGVTLLGPRA
ncbi:diacylglycerol kinase family protein [Erythrobacter litoralis]|uniref:DAGKc domain-containing protein n=1 Tax=Erythrobacter litoralis (strain HTCC2594) TaxID=314225 RepID=Q2N6M4_ERYLH|nr:diacylglycerol kinase family protein [Erythrobacter litoralis]ABC64667.1 hypothetical protein ELI_12875 [Erythrobacter litoralis HTCC2594]